MTGLQLALIALLLLIVVCVFTYFMVNRGKYIKAESDNKMELMEIINGMSSREAERVMIAHKSKAFADLEEEDES